MRNRGGGDGPLHEPREKCQGVTDRLTSLPVTGRPLGRPASLRNLLLGAEGTPADSHPFIRGKKRSVCSTNRVKVERYQSFYIGRNRQYCINSTSISSSSLPSPHSRSNTPKRKHLVIITRFGNCGLFSLVPK